MTPELKALLDAAEAFIGSDEPARQEHIETLQRAINAALAARDRANGDADDEPGLTDEEVADLPVGAVITETAAGMESRWSRIADPNNGELLWFNGDRVIADRPPIFRPRLASETGRRYADARQVFADVDSGDLDPRALIRFAEDDGDGDDFLVLAGSISRWWPFSNWWPAPTSAGVVVYSPDPQ